VHLHRSNRLELLADLLADLVKSPGLSPLEPEIIVVPNKGMERWLTMQLASRLGVAANARFPFPRRFLEESLAALEGRPGPHTDTFAPERLVFAIAALLPTHIEQPPFEPLRRYLHGESPQRRLLELATRIADTFDRYPIYRPERVLAWESGEGDDWQAILFRALIERLGPQNLAHRADKLAKAPTKRRKGHILPARVSVIDLGGLPPLFLQLFGALSRHCELHLFHLSPSREHWAEIQPRREISRALRRIGAAEDSAQMSLAFTEGNPLLASLGKLGRDTHAVLESHIEYQEGEHELYRCPDEDEGQRTMLATIQSDILHLRHRKPGSVEAPPRPLDPADRSITVHSCHGPMREIEVLRDQILGLLHDEPDTEPRDILVLTPDLETYAPLIEAAFDRDPRDPGYLPFRIAGRSQRAQSPAIDAFFAILDAAAGRTSSNALFELITREPVRARFGVEESDLDTLRSWLIDARVRWGVDAAHRQSFDQPGFTETTWRFGLERLLVGYAMPGEGRVLFQGTLPYDDIEGEAAALAGKLADFCEAFFAAQRALAESHTIARWRELLFDAMNHLLAEPEGQADTLQVLRDALASMAESAEIAGFDAAVPLAIVREQLEAVVAEAPPAAPGLLSGGVCFGSIAALRGIPARLICLVGMNHEGFPRPAHAPSFDRVAHEPRRGDRSPRDDDRYFFLQAILSARARLLITYVGQSAHEGSALPPSVVVGELLDAIDASFTREDGSPAREKVVLRHPLQPFSPAYFRPARDARLFSFAARFCQGARALVGQRAEAPAFFRAPLPPPEEDTAGVSIDALAAFFANPMRAIMRDRLGIDLRDDERALEGREPMTLKGLDEYALGSELIHRALAGDDLDEAYPMMRASGALPLGAVGRCRYELALPEIEEMVSAIRRLARGARLAPRPLDLRLEQARLTGSLRDLFPGAQLVYRFASVKASAELALWIRHLALSCALGAAHRGDTADVGAPRESVLVGRDKEKKRAAVVRFRPVAEPAEARARLAELVALYHLGQRTPLCFFPEASLAYAKAKARGKSDEDARRDAREVFSPASEERAAFSASADPYVARVLGRRDPTDPQLALVEAAGERNDEREASAPRFADLACLVFEPLLAHREAPHGEA